MVCFLAFALSIYLFTDAAIRLYERTLFPVRRPHVFLVGPFMGMWLLSTLALRCEDWRERLFYSIWIMDFLLIALRSAFPLPPSATWASNFVQLVLGLGGVALSGGIGSLHLRKGSTGQNG